MTSLPCTARRVALLAVVWFAMTTAFSIASGQVNDSFGIAPDPDQVNGVERGTFSIPLEPGSTWEDNIRIFNRTDQTLDLVVYAADAEAGPDDTEIRPGFRTDSPKGVGSWIDLSRDTIQLAAHDEIIVAFRVEVKTSEPNPMLGAIVVENTARGLAANARQREFLPVRTVSPNTETASVRVRPLVLRSPWVMVAMLGLVVVGAVVWIGARRAKRPKDVLVPAGEIDQPEPEPEEVPDASRPVIKRLGANEKEMARATTNATATAGRAGDDRPLLEDAFLVEVEMGAEEGADVDAAPAELDDDEAFFEDEEEDDEEDLPPARHRPVPKKRPAPQKRRTVNAKTTKATPKTKPAKKTRTSAKKTSAKKPSAHPAAKRATPRNGKPKGAPGSKSQKQAPAYIPLDDL